LLSYAVAKKIVSRRNRQKVLLEDAAVGMMNIGFFFTASVMSLKAGDNLIRTERALKQIKKGNLLNSSQISKSDVVFLVTIRA